MTSDAKVVYLARDLDQSSLPPGFTTGLVDSSSIPAHVYLFDLALESAGAVTLRDVEDSIYTLNVVGGASMILGRDRNTLGQSDSIPPEYYPLPVNAIAPRIFGVREDGSGWELMDQRQVKLWMKEIARDPHTRPMGESDFLIRSQQGGDQRATAKSLKYLTTLTPPPAYSRHPVIPNVLRAAPSALIAGSSLSLLETTDPLVVLKGPSVKASPIPTEPVLIYRHLLHLPRVTLSQKSRAFSLRSAFQDFRESQSQSELAYRQDLLRQERSEEEVREEKRVQEEIARAREAVKERKAAHARALAEADALAADPSLKKHKNASRPSTANSHRTASSSSLLPKPAHEVSEGEAVLSAMVATLTAPPKTFFAQKKAAKEGGEAPVQQKEKGRPTSAARNKVTVADLSPASFSSFFTHPSFRRDFLLSRLLSRMTELASPPIPGSRAREGEEESQEEKEEAWMALTEEQRETYQQQYTSQLGGLVASCLEFADLAGAFLLKPYSEKARQIHLQEDPYLALVDRGPGSPFFSKIVESLAGVLGYERENERLVLTVKEEMFQENVRAMKSKMDELMQSVTNAAPVSPKKSQQAHSQSPAYEEGGEGIAERYQR